VTFSKHGLPLLLLIVALGWGPAATANEPRRTDHGDLIVLDLYGSYREMARRPRSSSARTCAECSR